VTVPDKKVGKVSARLDLDGKPTKFPEIKLKNQTGQWETPLM
jgi:hypothetical protein